jgi:hypothetical protein
MAASWKKVPASPARGQGERFGKAQRHGKATFGAVDQTPSQTFAFAFLIDGDSYLLQDHKVAIDGALGAAEFARGVRDGQSTTLVEQTNQPLLPSQGATPHRGSVYAWCDAAVNTPGTVLPGTSPRFVSAELCPGRGPGAATRFPGLVQVGDRR